MATSFIVFRMAVRCSLLPLVAVLNAYSINAARPDGSYDKGGEVAIEKTISAFLMALLICVVFELRFFYWTSRLAS